MDKATIGTALGSFQTYTQAFQSLDAKAVSLRFYEPAILITPKGVVALSSAADVEQAYARIMAELPALGYAGTEFSAISERKLGDDLSLVTGGGTWKKASGERFMPFGMTYTLRRSGDEWLIVVAAIHAPDSRE
jgi:ketosteroid isomerase-like protein